MKNAKLIIVWIILLCVLMGVGLGVFFYENGYFANKNIAFAVTQSGEVLHIVGADAIAVPDQTILLAGEGLQTTDGEALITINENHFIWLMPNTKITLESLTKDKINMTLISGDIWYMHVNSSDKQQFILEDALATIAPAGTKFLAHYDDKNLNTSVYVVEGTVEISDAFLDLTLAPFEKAYKTDTVVLNKIPPSESDKLVAKVQLDRDYSILKSARTAEINRHSTILNIVKSKFNVTDEQIQEALAKIDTGELSEEQLLSQSPVPIPTIGRIKELDAAAKKTLQIVNQLLTQ